MSLPPDARAYRRTDMFTEANVPAGLLKAHATRDGVWAVIHVTQGLLAYRVTDPRRLASSRTLSPSTAPGLVEPTILHEIEPLGPVRFYVEFHRRQEEPCARSSETPPEQPAGAASTSGPASTRRETTSR